jgi:glycosyltransferase involved in cell wall biosynthesis
LKPALVSIVILNTAKSRLLSRAIDSALGQTWTETEIIVIHDGSADGGAEIIARHPEIRGLAPAVLNRAEWRNAGLHACRGDYVVFVESDSVLEPAALEIGVTKLDADESAGFAVGACRSIDDDGNDIGEVDGAHALGVDRYAALLRDNFIKHAAAVILRRSAIEQVGAFNILHAACCDWDLYLRIAYRFPIVYHHELIAKCRNSKTGGSQELIRNFVSALRVLDCQRPFVAPGRRRWSAYRAGVKSCTRRYGSEILRCSLVEFGNPDTRRSGLVGIRFVLFHAPSCITTVLANFLVLACRRVASKMCSVVPSDTRKWLSALRQRLQLRPPLGWVRFGNLRRLTPISRNFGFDRGLPVDRVYIEAFLASHAADVQGRVLEFGDNSYTLRFGGDRVIRSDVFSVGDARGTATFVGDLASTNDLPSDAFDCIIITQVLQLIYDLPEAVRTLYRVLKPGGIVLATMPGLTPIHACQWQWFWSMTPSSAARLFNEHFDSEGIEVETHGNVLTATAFLYGLAAEELTEVEFDYTDPSYPVIVTARAVKPHSLGLGKIMAADTAT